MGKKTKSPSLGKIARVIGARAWPGSIWRRIVTVIFAVVLLFTALSYGVAEWYIHSDDGQPLQLGTSFIADYAQSYGLDPQQTLSAILSQLQIKQLRLVSYWEDIEPQPGVYDFSTLDWEFALAHKYGATVSLSIGLRQPRWPECHEPSWVANEPTNVWEPQLYSFMKAVIERYKDNPALGSYELENEFFLSVFGQCTNFDRSRLVREFNMVKQLDPRHTIIISRSDNWVGIPINQPVPDEYAISVYKRVWDSTITHRYFEYPLPPWFYAALAGYEKLYSGKDMIIHELQTEPWAPNGLQVTQLSTQEMAKSMNASILQKRIGYAEDTGMRTIYLWGAEWWYWMKIDKHDASDWDVVRQAVSEANTQNQKLASRAPQLSYAIKS